MELTDKEIGGFGISDADDPLHMVDFRLVKQEVAGASVDLEDEAVSEFLALISEEGLQPWQAMRIYIHTHPFAKSTPSPSGTDESTFATCFGNCSWAVMVIVGGSGDCYSRFKMNGYPGCWSPMDVCIDWAREFPGSNHPAWVEEFKANVFTKVWQDATRVITPSGAASVKDAPLFPKHVGSQSGYIPPRNEAQVAADKAILTGKRPIGSEWQGIGLCDSCPRADSIESCMVCKANPCVNCMAVRVEGLGACEPCDDADIMHNIDMAWDYDKSGLAPILPDNTSDAEWYYVPRLSYMVIKDILEMPALASNSAAAPIEGGEADVPPTT